MEVFFYFYFILFLFYFFEISLDEEDVDFDVGHSPRNPNPGNEAFFALFRKIQAILQWIE